MDVTYATVKVYVTERIYIIERHSILVITIWRTSAIEVTALLKKIYAQKWKVSKKKNLSWVWGVDRKIRPSRSLSGITWKPRDARQWSLVRIFLFTLHTNDRPINNL